MEFTQMNELPTDDGIVNIIDDKSLSIEKEKPKDICEEIGENFIMILNFLGWNCEVDYQKKI